MRGLLAAGIGLVWIGCASAPVSRDAAGGDEPPLDAGAAADAGSRELGPDELAFFEAALRGVEFSFRDPLTLGRHTASGPYTLVASNRASVEFTGYDDHYGLARVILFVDDDRLWARVSIEGQEYLTRIQ